MKDTIIFGFIASVFLAIYFIIYRYLWLTFIPENTMTEVIGVFLIVVLLIPVSLVSAQKLISYIRH